MNKKINKYVFISLVVIIYFLLIYVGRFYILLYLNSALIGALIMRELDDIQSYNFKFKIFLLLLINMSILILFLGNYIFRDLVQIIYLPFALSYISGVVYFLIKGNY
jgi:hypothetical protein